MVLYAKSEIEKEKNGLGKHPVENWFITFTAEDMLSIFFVWQKLKYKLRKLMKPELRVYYYLLKPDSSYVLLYGY